MKIAIIERLEAPQNASGFATDNLCTFNLKELLDCVDQSSADISIYPTIVFETGRTQKTFIGKSFRSGHTDAIIGDYVYYQKNSRQYGYKIIGVEVTSLASEGCCIYDLIGESINPRECKPLEEACGKTEEVEWQG